ncbi:MAG TPA: bifunctional adenosylcobinamide kinase/adenosylcobinamide-phosphate guanylyltransferase [Ktedonobacteraceae bacterium]|nr:bifunctional adenosylcobinamide kinase/adenosylcobinamide-phosphate guanylyltransferase [Ktedonobacteraceae bacterium]
MNDNQQQPAASSSHSDRSDPSAEGGARLILILGGARSGKSTFAEQLAINSGKSVAFIATATAGDEEMRARIARHQAERPREWQTIEEPLDLPRAIHRASALADVLLLDCLTLWTSNWLMQQTEGDYVDEADSASLPGESALAEVEDMLRVLRSLPAQKTLIAISNEVGLGVVPAYPLGRVYRDTLGYVNQRLARDAERVYMLVAGIAVDLKRIQELPML